MGRVFFIFLFFWGGFASSPFGVMAFAQSLEDWQLELEQLQAQVDVALEEANTLQRYRICAEKGRVYQPGAASQIDEDGCSLPAGVAPAPQQTTPQKAASKNPVPSSATPSNQGVKKPLAQTAKTFRLPPPGVVTGQNIPLKEVAPLVGQQNGQPEEGGKSLTPMPLHEGGAAATASQAPLPPLKAAEMFPILDPDYPNDQVKQLIEAAVERALTAQMGGAALTTPEGLAPFSAPSPFDGGLTAPAAAAPGTITQPENAVPSAPAPQTLQAPSQVAGESTPILPSCRPGEFLTAVQGQVVCQTATNIGKLACPPSTLRVWVEWQGKHVHFQVGYTPHGQEHSSTEKSNDITVACDNGKYKLLDITRNECGGHFCHPNQKPAYTLKYICNQDATGRCYAQQDGRLLNHVFTQARISQQY